MGFAQTHKGLLEEKPLDRKNFKQGDFTPLLFVCTDSDVAVFRATISGCSEPNPVERDLCACALSATG